MGDCTRGDKCKQAELAIVNEQLQGKSAEPQWVEASPRRSEKLLSDFFENAGVGMHWLGADGYVLRVNQAQLNLLGYTRDEYLGHHISKFFVDQAALEDIFQRLLSHRSLCDYEVQLYCKDGSIKSVAINSNALWEDDIFIHTRCVVRDITERKQAEVALQKRERQLTALLNNIPDIAWLKDRDSRFIAVNEPFGRACGMKPENLVGKTDYDVWDLALAQKYRDDDAAVITSRQRQCFEEPLADRFGRTTWIETIKTPVFNDLGQVIGITGIARDVTQRQQLEVYLRKSKRLSLILNATETGIWDWDILIDKAFWSDSLFKLIGREPGSCEPSYQNWLKSIHPDDQEQLRFCVEQAIANRSGINFETRAVLPDGSIRWLGIIGETTHSDERGRSIRMVGVTTDITDRIQIEAERQYAEANLRELTHQLQQQNAQLAEVSRLKSEFLANMSHELRTPLTSILGFSSVLLKQHFGALTAKQEQYLARIHTSGEHLLALINDLLDLVKIEAGKLELQIEAVDLTDLCETALQIVEVRALEKQQMLALELPIACERVAIDRQRILQVLLNYLSNAIKFTPAGGTIRLSTRLSSSLEAAQTSFVEGSDRTAPSTSASQFVVLSVCDTGMGVPFEQQHLLFQVFQQIDAALNRPHEGTGLGLALTKRLVELHKGKVSFSSTPGVGSTFSAWLPLV